MTPSSATPASPSTQTLWAAVLPLAAFVTASILAAPLLFGAGAWYLAVLADLVALAMSGVLAWLYMLQRAERLMLAQHHQQLERQAADLLRTREEGTGREDVRQTRVAELSAGHEAAVAMVERLVGVLPEAIAGRAVPPSDDEGLDPRLVKLRDTALEAAAEAGRDNLDVLESQQLTIVALARRVQSAMHRVQAEAATTAERNRDLPEVYLACQNIDHLAAQAARLAQGLAVVCGTWEGQQWDAPMRLAEVVQAAQARIEDYQRVSVEGDPDIAIAPMALESVIHVMAELLANATESSPTATTVSVKVTAAAQGAVFRVDDHGAGLEEPRFSQARQLLNGLHEVNLAEMGEVPRLGLPVVARYVRRHGFKVSLDESPYGGLQAVVLVPKEMVTAAPSVMAVGGELHERRAEPSRAPAAAPADPTASPSVRTGSSPVPSPPATSPSPAGPPPDGADPSPDGQDAMLPRRVSRRREDGGAKISPPPIAPSPESPEEAGALMGALIQGTGVANPQPPVSSGQNREGPQRPSLDHDEKN